MGTVFLEGRKGSPRTYSVVKGQMGMKNEQKGVFMNFTKSILRRVLGGLFALALVAVSFPMAAFALETGVSTVQEELRF